MREIRKSGSEGGAGQNNVPFLPLSLFRCKVQFQRDNGMTLILWRSLPLSFSRTRNHYKKKTLQVGK